MTGIPDTHLQYLVRSANRKIPFYGRIVPDGKAVKLRPCGGGVRLLVHGQEYIRISGGEMTNAYAEKLMPFSEFSAVYLSPEDIMKARFGATDTNLSRLRTLFMSGLLSVGVAGDEHVRIRLNFDHAWNPTYDVWAAVIRSLVIGLRRFHGDMTPNIVDNLIGMTIRQPRKGVPASRLPVSARTVLTRSRVRRVQLCDREFDIVLIRSYHARKARKYRAALMGVSTATSYMQESIGSKFLPHIYSPDNDKTPDGYGLYNVSHDMSDILQWEREIAAAGNIAPDSRLLRWIEAEEKEL